MKKAILTTIVLGFLTLAAHAQYLGIKGGLNFSNLNIDQVDDNNLRTGYHLGAYVNLPITEGFGIQPEVLFSTKGNKAHFHRDAGIFGEVNEAITTKLNYIDIPLLAVFKLGKIAEIEVGPYFGFLANSKIEFDGTFDGSDDLDNDSFKSLDYGLTGGFAVNLAAIQVGARYNYGLQKIEDSSIADFLYSDAKNSYFQVFAALRFGDY